MTKSEPPGPSAAAESPRRSGTPPEDPFAPDPTEKLQKVLARQGHGSRRKCEEMILAGRVTVNGKVAELGARIDATADLVAVDGVAVGVQPDAVYYLLNKPKGVLSAAADDRTGRSANRVGARCTQAIDRRTRHRIGQPGQECGHARDIAIVFSRLIGSAENDFVNIDRVERGIARDQRADRVRRKIIGTHTCQRTAKSPDGCANGVTDECRSHSAKPI